MGGDFIKNRSFHKVEFQAVIMAAGLGSRMMDLTVRTPKPLLPIGNKPMVWYSVNLLEEAGFKDAFIVIRKSALKDVKKTLEEVHPVNINLEYIVITDSEESGTADILRHIKDKITTDLLVISCDLVAEILLQNLVDLHRIKDADLTMLLAPEPDISQTSVPCPKVNRKLEQDYIGIEENTKRVVYMKAVSDCPEGHNLNVSLLERHPSFTISKRLMDAHLYLMKKEMLDVLVDCSHISMVKGELVPMLVNKKVEITKKQKLANSGQIGLDDFPADEDEEIDLDEAVEQMCLNYVPKHGEVRQRATCYAHVLETGLCIRANTLVTYCEANRQIAKKEAAQNLAKATAATGATAVATGKQSQQTSTDSLISESATLGERVGIKWSVIGDHSKIKDQVKITNCVIMDHVTIDSGAVLTGCIVGDNAHILGKAELKDSIVGSGQTVNLGKYSNEVLLDANQMMEI